MNDHTPIHAVLKSSEKPTDEQFTRMEEFLKQKHSQDVFIEWECDPVISGIRLEIGTHVYDWNTSNLFTQLSEHLKNISTDTNGSVIPLLSDAVKDWTPKALAQEVGEVLTIGDSIATISGLEHATYGEILLFSTGARGMVQDMKKNKVGCIIFGGEDDITQGSIVKRTGRTAGIPVGEGFIGRVVDALGSPIDAKGPIEAKGFQAIEHPAPGIIDRQPVTEPLETGIMAIDAMIPIGKGQRELIIGDRQTGKTAIAVDTILNQKGKDVICIYVAIGQKASSVAQLSETLRAAGAMEYTAMVCAFASESAPMQYIAPYSGCALAEYFMQQGKDVLIVYDDLSKHAIAYRALSLLLERAPGREAYPGDVFYLHSRLLERAARLSEDLGGGSITALPIVETQAGDVSAYIPTNIISITDGQIFLESDLFFAGQRPAVNVGISVSRVGGSAQTKALKKAAGTLRLELSQYREMEVFTLFSADLDLATKQRLAFGRNLMELLKQPQSTPMSQHELVITLVAAMGHTMQDLPPEDVKPLSQKFCTYMEEYAPHICTEIEQSKTLSDDARDEILSLAQQYFATAK